MATKPCPQLCATSVIIDSSNTSIDQDGNGYDTATCVLNALVNGLNESLSSILKQSIQIDIDGLINCNPGWNKPSYIPYPFNNDKALAEIYSKYSAAEIQRMKDVATFVNYLRKGSAITIPIRCQQDTQSPTYTPQSYDCSCVITANVEAEIEKPNEYRDLCSLLNELKKTKLPMLVAFDLSQLPNYYNNSNSDTIINGGIVHTLQPGQSDLGFGHAVSFIGYECKNGMLEMIFKDSYDYGTTIKRPGIFRIAVDPNLLHTGNPIRVGMPISHSTRISKLYVSRSSIKPSIQEIKDNLIPICCPTPTPSPSHIAPTPTPSLSYAIPFSPFRFQIP